MPGLWNTPSHNARHGFLFKNSMRNTPIIIAGSGRSGTTWVLDAIAKPNRLRTVFEPLHPVGVPSAKEFANRYVPDNAKEVDLKRFMDRVLSGQFRSIWTDYRVRPDRFRFDKGFSVVKSNYKKLVVHYFRYLKKGSDGLVVKFIRANLMLGWIRANYDARILFIVRHPGAVIASKISLGGPDWTHTDLLKKYSQDERLLRDYLWRNRDLVSSPLDPVQGHAIVWCIENAIPLQYAHKNGYCVAFYEDLILNPEQEWQRVITGLGLQNMPEKDMLALPSQQVSKTMRNKRFDADQIGRWMSFFSQEQLAEIDRTLKIFSISSYSAFDPVPVRGGDPYTKGVGS